ncbi:hypothetical protein BOTBODRAFT_120729, partial [Botryobasidium botryosum FD-172 SS1]
NKYYHLTGECEVYQIALILCPDKKLKWFTDNNRSADEIEEARKTITHQFNESYNTNPAAPPASVSAAPKRSHSKYLQDLPSAGTLQDDDTIAAYLDEPLLSQKMIEDGGGYLAYWERARERRPKLSQMALDFLSAPGRLYLICTGANPNKSFIQLLSIKR